MISSGSSTIFPGWANESQPGTLAAQEPMLIAQLL